MAGIRVLTTSGTVFLDLAGLQATGFVGSGIEHDGRQRGRYGVHRYGRCKYGLPPLGVYDHDEYGDTTYG